MDDIAVEIDDILIRSLQGRISEAEAETLRRWRTRSPENEEHYQYISSTWRMTADYEDPVWEAPPSARGVLRTARQGSRSGRARTGLNQALSAAAVIAALGFGYLVAQWTSSPSAETLAQQTELTTGDGERTTVNLWDGTAVRLGPRSTLRVLRNGNDAVARLEGRAFFGVSHDPSRTFTVETEHGQALALGTRFEVQTEEDELRVLVVEGNVRVSSAGTPVDVEEGRVSRSAERVPPSTSLVENIDELLDWMGPVLIFRETPLERAVAEIEHRYGVTVHVEDPIRGDMPVTATFTDQPAENVLFVVCEIIGAECVVEADQFRIRQAE